MRSDIDLDVFFSEVFQLRDELNDLSETVTGECLTSIILDALSEEIYSIAKMQSGRDPNIGLEKIIGMMKSSVPKRSKESYRKVRSSGREPRTDNMREYALTLTCHNCKKPGHEKKNCKELMGKSDKPSHVEDGIRK